MIPAFSLSTNLRHELLAIARIAAPTAVAQAGLVAMTLVDTAIVGRVSVDELAAASMGRAILFATGGLGIGVGVAIEPLAAQALGAGERERAWSALGATLRASLLVSTVAIALGFLVTLFLVPAGIDAALVPRVQAYMVGHTPATFCFAMFAAGRAFLQVLGHTRPAVMAVALANAVNFLVCSVLVRGDDALADVGLPALGLPRLGALGAGIAASVGGLALIGWILTSARRLRADLAPEKSTTGTERPVEPVTVRSVLRIGVPAGMQILVEGGVFSTVALAAGRMGVHVVSAHQVAIGLASFSFMSMIGVSSATAVRVGYAVGAGRSARGPGLLGIAMGSTLMLVSATLFALFPRQLVGLFSQDARVIEVGVSLMRVAAIFQIFDGAQAVAAGALRGAGDTRVSFLANLAAHWLLGFPLALLFGFALDLGATGLWMGLTAGLVVVSVLLTLRFVRLTRGLIARV
ncbi:MATE family efflux transporter [Chondromyces crocatus]|uniref:Multidrug-efflux transporter n=1 Tax=Chondromyces crocatus TaxID=52 RepID=A0A0K1EMM8_CHOCO|nr:MATE family efflux transporter [Chondromyces crocatus]AKT42160.1 uncharacterized protein CMC5_063830 [Chondromyces crocatus]